MERERPAEDDQVERLFAGLVSHGLIVPVDVHGIFGRGAVFEDVLRRVDEMIVRQSAEPAESLTFPPVIDRSVIQRTDYLDSFPQLAGLIYGFLGDHRDAHQLSGRVHRGEPWGELMSLTDVCLNPAACYPLYPTMTGVLPLAGRLVTMLNWVYRREPSPEPTRMQAFRVREFVRAGSPAMVLEWREAWIRRGLDLLRRLGLPAQTEVASDPFFGRVGAVLAEGQRAQQLKFEVVVPVVSDDHPTALCSFNYHQDHFGHAFDIHQDDGSVAHTACLGFGLERVVIALFRHHGFDPDSWPAEVRAEIWC